MIVGLDSYPSPALVIVIVASLPVCSSKVKASIASVVGASPLAVIFTVGTLLYPKPVVANVTVSNANPKIAVPAAFAPVVSPVAGVNDMLGALADS